MKYTVAFIVLVSAFAACQKPLPVSPDMREEFTPGSGATNYPPMNIGKKPDARDAGDSGR